MKASLVGKFLLELEKVTIISFRGGTFNHEISGDKPIVIAPVKGVILENRQLVVSETADLCIEENEGFILVKMCDPADPVIVDAIKKDPDSLKFYKKMKEGIEKFFESIPAEGEIARMFTLLMVNVRGEKLVSELMNAAKEAFPDLYDKVMEKMDPTDLAILVNYGSKNRI